MIVSGDLCRKCRRTRKIKSCVYSRSVQTSNGSLKSVYPYVLYCFKWVFPHTRPGAAFLSPSVATVLQAVGTSHQWIASLVFVVLKLWATRLVLDLTLEGWPSVLRDNCLKFAPLFSVDRYYSSTQMGGVVSLPNRETFTHSTPICWLIPMIFCARAVSGLYAGLVLSNSECVGCLGCWCNT